MHGVSGTPPQEPLEHPTPRMVAGDTRAGFWRRWSPTGQAPDPPGRRVEAYSWGALTSGGASRALWLLLLPFALVNVASWTEPGDPSAALRRRHLVSGALRLLALTLTGTLVLAAATVGMDLLAWQCARPGTTCASQSGPPAWLAFLGSPGRRLVGGALLPAAVVALLWYLGNRTWGVYERETMPSYAGAREDFTLGDPRFWNGDLPVQRLRALHVAAAWALVAVLVVDPLRRWAADAGWPLYLGAVLVEVFAVGLVLAAALAVLVPSIADRRRARTGTRRRKVPRGWSLLPVLGIGLLVAASVLAVVPGSDEWVSTGPMPLLSALLHMGFFVQAGLLIALAVLVRGLPRDPEPLVRPAVGGLALPMLAGLGWLLAGGFAAGLAVRIAARFGEAVTDEQGYAAWVRGGVALRESPLLADRLAALERPDPLFVPALFPWVSLVAALLILAVLPSIAAWAALLLRRRTARVRGRLLAQGSGADKERIATIARTHGRAAFSDDAPRILGVLVLVTVVMVLAAAVGYVIDASLPTDRLGWLTGFGSWAMGALAVLLVGLGRAAYNTPQLRRTVGILWDLASFWPRAVHPLAPPCYSERVLPDLVERSRSLTRGESDRLLLSGHSQGSVIVLATVLQLPRESARRTGVLTYGSPLTRLYAAFFPGYVGRHAYREAAARLGAPPTDPTTWPWRNLYRLSDPIGGWLLAPVPVHSPGTVDQQLVDPVFDRTPGDPAFPRAFGHFEYWTDPRFDPAAGEVLAIRAALAGALPAPQSRPT